MKTFQVLDELLINKRKFFANSIANYINSRKNFVIRKSYTRIVSNAILSLDNWWKRLINVELLSRGIEVVVLLSRVLGQQVADMKMTEFVVFHKAIYKSFFIQLLFHQPVRFDTFDIIIAQNEYIN